MASDPRTMSKIRNGAADDLCCHPMWNRAEVLKVKHISAELHARNSTSSRLHNHEGIKSKRWGHTGRRLPARGLRLNMPRSTTAAAQRNEVRMQAQGRGAFVRKQHVGRAELGKAKQPGGLQTLMRHASATLLRGQGAQQVLELMWKYVCDAPRM